MDYFSSASLGTYLGATLLGLALYLPILGLYAAIDPRGFRSALRSFSGVGYMIGIIPLVGLVLGAMLIWLGASENLKHYGWITGGISLLILKLLFFIALPHLFAALFPKMGSVALAAYREAWRQPTFWLILIGGIVMTRVAVWIPYYTLGDDYKMFRHIGYDIIMLASVIFGCLVTSVAISEEIEGRTAITVMSKPITRRAFLLGKFLGVLMACGAMASIMTGNLNQAFKSVIEFDQLNKDTSIEVIGEQAKAIFKPRSENLPAGPARVFAEGMLIWFAEEFATSMGTALIFGQVMILIAIATALATRLPFVVNLTIVLSIYVFGNLAPVVVRVTQSSSGSGQTSQRLIGFFAKLFDTILPTLEFFNMGPAIIRDTPLPIWSFAGYVLTVLGYSVLYTTIALLVGLLLFEDRDLA